MTAPGSLLRLRDYQRQTIDAARADLDKPLKRVACVLPTGAGKTVVFSHLTKEYRDAHSDRRVMILVHTDELVQQTVKKLHDVAPDLRVGIVKGTRNEVTAQVLVCSVQSLRSDKRLAMIRRVGLIIVDECHHATAKTYHKVLTHFGCFGDETGAVAVGFTATLARGDGQSLGEIWQKVSFRRDILFMIRRGYLLDVRGKSVEVPDLDLSGVKATRKDYREGELGEALTHSMAPELVAKAYAEHAAERSGVMFVPTVDAAYTFADALTAIGISAEVVHGALDRTLRRDIIRRLASGETQVVVNCMVLTEGFDCPRVSCVVVARPTKSAPLYQQMVGRGLRVDPSVPREGQDCLVLDVVGAGRMHDLRSLVDLTSSKRPVKPGQTLTEADDEWQEELESLGQGREAEDWYRGPVEYRDFDPLARESSWVWLTTKEGTRFLAAGPEKLVFLTPGEEPGSWDVTWCTTVDRRVGTQGGFTDHVGIDLEMAMTWAEQVADEVGGDAAAVLGKKNRRWHREPATPGQLGEARRLKINAHDDWRKGDFAQAISHARASLRIDPIVRYFKKERGIS